ncbi:hypothetical protein PAERUG_P54_1_London_24_VIM_2_04_13_01384 [Pseudomonas aeruginosa]|nr:hypothetical protein PAERUG_E5_London_17_VIM_2_12_12_04696 [Pseudomonas aeruginosa]CRW98862.1 hypothetical protein PAERUG_P54_1_London_24_VIM_2_04_13_01384 [Pseudomonas aeruginosa]
MEVGGVSVSAMYMKKLHLGQVGHWVYYPIMR